MYTLPQLCCPKCQKLQLIHSNSLYMRCIYCSTNAYIIWCPHALELPPPSLRKKAVICGITYDKNPVYAGRLNGSANDAISMKNLLKRWYGFQDPEIFMLTEDQFGHTGEHEIPTRANIIKALSWLVDGCDVGDSLVFYFSGHGCQVSDKDGDEIDGFDECLLAMDFDGSKGGVIVDDDLNRLIVSAVPRGVNLHAIIDACRSGTVLDLRYLWSIQRDGTLLMMDQRRPQDRPSSGVEKDTRGGEVICFSACDDSQKAAEIPGERATGAMTSSFVEAIERRQAVITYGSLMREIGQSMRFKGLEAGVQDPRLTSDKLFDVERRLFAI